MTEVGSVTALLKLDASGFDTGINNSINKITKFVTSMEKLGKNSTSFAEGFRKIHNELLAFDTALTQITSNISKFESFRKMGSGLNEIASAVQKFNTEGVSFDASLQAMSASIRTFMASLGGVEVTLKGVINAETQVISKTQEVNSALSSKYNAGAEFERLKTSLLEVANGLTQLKGNINQSITSVNSLKNSFQSVNTSMNQLGAEGNTVTTTIQRVNTSMNQLCNTSRTTNSSISQLATTFQQISMGANSTIASIERLTLALSQSRSAMSNMTSAQVNYSTGVNNTNSALSSTATHAENLNTTLNKSTTGLSNLSKEYYNASQSANKMGTATQQAAQKGVTAQGSFRGLTSVLSSLKNMGMMVASMFAYNFLHSLGQAVSQTIRARSEMYSMFQTMGMTQKQIGSFNNALDRTVAQFKRVNKYSLGETVASMGVEFNLSTKEMEKALSVTSMITSEYLRAGRNANEASLAVKDVMQGEFQRLSRETGVKGEQLKAAGWNGDNTDVMSLMEALEKVGKSRNWDVFAEKANSLNDIILITQNRFAEWAADMSQYIIPAITTGFNILIVAVNGISRVFGALGGVLNLPDWAGAAIAIGAITTAIIGLIPVLITSRTGIGLLDMATRGWKDSILGAVFGLNLEKNATLSSTQALSAKLLGLNTEIVAQHGVKDAIITKVLGLNAEEVAENGVRSAIIKKTNSEKLAGLQDRNSLSIIFAKIAGLKMEEVAEHGVVGAIGKKITKLFESIGVLAKDTAAHMSHTAAVLAGTLAIGGMVVAVAALVVAIAALVQPIIDSCNQMKKFNDIIQQSDQLLKDANETAEHYKKREEDASKQLSTLKEGTAEYNAVLSKMNDAHSNANYMYDTYIPNMEKASKIAKEAQDRYDTGKIEAAAESERKLNEELVKLGINEQIAGDMSSNYLRDAENGSKILYHALQVYNKNLEDQRGSVVELTAKLKSSGHESEEIKEIMDPYQRALERYNENKQVWMTSADIGERFTAGLGMNIDAIDAWWQKLNINFKSQDWEGLYKTIQEGIGTSVGRIPLDFIKSVISGYQNLIKDSELGDIIRGLFDFKDNFDLGKIIGNWFNFDSQNVGGLIRSKINPAMILEPLIELWNGLTSWFGEFNLSEMLQENLITPFTDLWEGFTTFFTDFDIPTMFQEYFITPFTEMITTFLADPFMGLFGEGGFGLTSLLTGLFGADPLTTITTFMQMNVIQPLSTSLITVPFTFLSYAQQAGSNFLNGVVQFISQLPGQVYSYISQTTSHIISGAAQWASTARSKASEMITAVISQVSQIPGLVYNELMKVGERIRAAIGNAVSAMTDFGAAIVGAFRAATSIFSPGIIQQITVKEIADTITGIFNQSGSAGDAAYELGSSIVDGFQNVVTDDSFTFDASGLGDFSSIITALQTQLSGESIDLNELVVGDASTMSEEAMGAFNMLAGTISTTYTDMDMNVGTTMTNIDAYQTSMLTNMQTQNTNAFNQIQTKTNTSLNGMRDSTSRVTQQMTSAWNVMKNNIVSAANQLQTQSTAHFNTLSNHIGTFYRKLQNPSMWGAGDSTPTRYYNSSRGNRGINSVKRFFGIPMSTPRGRYAGGYSPDNLPERMSLRRLRRIVGNYSMFEGMDLDKEVDVRDFLGQFNGSFGWADWNGKHFNHIKTTTGDWNMRGPQIMHRIDTGIDTFHPKEFYNSTPQISFDSFRKMAEALFSAIRYEFYYNSDAHGSWQAALQAGSCNCWDGAHALMALAATCGFSSSLGRGTWNGVPHVFAIVNGMKMDTTGWQQRGSWAGVAAGSPPSRAYGTNHINHGNTTVNVNVDMSGTVAYGVDDLESAIDNGVNKALNENFLSDLSVGI